MIFDIESDGLLEEATKVHIFGWTLDGESYNTTTDPEEFLSVLSQQPWAGAHNSFRFDFPLLKKLYGYEYGGLKIDTLFNSWDLFPRRPKHGLEYLGEEHGVKKVQV